MIPDRRASAITQCCTTGPYAFPALATVIARVSGSALPDALFEARSQTSWGIGC